MDFLLMDEIKKTFGSQTVLDKMTLSIKENTLYGLIGRNGAGKTTTMKILLGILNCDSGKIFIKGKETPVHELTAQISIGYLSDTPAFYEYMTAREYLQFCGKLLSLETAVLKDRIEYLLDLVGLGEVSNNKHIAGYSKGMKQRLGLAQALVNSPQFLVCDEPTSALDPVGRKEFLDILVQLKKQTTILLSSHSLSDVEMICDDIGILDEGKIKLAGSINDLRSKFCTGIMQVEFQTEEDLNKAKKLMEGISGYTVEENQYMINISDGSAYKKVLPILFNNNVYPISFAQKKETLESLFLQVIV